jgi:hypothetical protein
MLKQIEQLRQDGKLEPHEDNAFQADNSKIRLV